MRRICVTLAVLLLGAHAAIAAPYSSKPQPVVYTGEKNLFSDVDFDTGWVPANSPIQVHFAIHIGTGWTAQAGGKGELSWPEPLSFSMVGNNQAGSLSMSLGVEMLARLRVCIPTPNCDTLHWEGDVPYIPNFDYRLHGETLFTPFLLPGATPATAVVSDSIAPVTLFQIDLLNLIGISIPGVSGGFELKAGGDVTATLTGVRFDVEDGVGGVLGTIEHDPGAFILALPEQPHREAWPNWHANLNAVGTLDLQPAVYIEFGGNEYSLALFTLPLDIINIDFPWDFGTKKTTFPLPVIRVTDEKIDFGVLKTGVTTTRDLKVDNAGEMELLVDATVEGSSAFSVPATTLTVGPGASGYLKVSVTAPDNNATGTLRLASSDPKQPFLTLALLVAGQGDVEQVPGDGGAPVNPEEPDPALGCGCAAAPVGASGLALLALFLVGRRRRR
jgi:MYXO-CTERM domain-containing protein